MRGCLSLTKYLEISKISAKFELNENIIDMTPMLIIHSDPDVVLFLIEIVLLIGILLAAFVAAGLIVRITKCMIVELYEGIKFTIEYWRDKDGRNNGMYN